MTDSKRKLVRNISMWDSNRELIEKKDQLSKSMDKDRSFSKLDGWVNSFNKIKDHHLSSDLRKTYLRNFGVQMDLPAYYIKGAKLVPHEINLVVTLAFHVFP